MILKSKKIKQLQKENRSLRKKIRIQERSFDTLMSCLKGCINDQQRDEYEKEVQERQKSIIQGVKNNYEQLIKGIWNTYDEVIDSLINEQQNQKPNISQEQLQKDFYNKRKSLEFILENTLKIVGSKFAQQENNKEQQEQNLQQNALKLISQQIKDLDEINKQALFEFVQKFYQKELQNQFEQFQSKNLWQQNEMFEKYQQNSEQKIQSLKELQIEIVNLIRQSDYCKGKSQSPKDACHLQELIKNSQNGLKKGLGKFLLNQDYFIIKQDHLVQENEIDKNTEEVLRNLKRINNKLLRKNFVEKEQNYQLWNQILFLENQMNQKDFKIKEKELENYLKHNQIEILQQQLKNQICYIQLQDQSEMTENVQEIYQETFEQFLGIQEQVFDNLFNTTDKRLQQNEQNKQLQQQKEKVLQELQEKLIQEINEETFYQTQTKLQQENSLFILQQKLLQIQEQFQNLQQNHYNTQQTIPSIQEIIQESQELAQVQKIIKKEQDQNQKNKSLKEIIEIQQEQIELLSNNQNKKLVPLAVLQRLKKIQKNLKKDS